jgi:hypothetical protein
VLLELWKFQQGSLAATTTQPSLATKVLGALALLAGARLRLEHVQEATQPMLRLDTQGLKPVNSWRNHSDYHAFLEDVMVIKLFHISFLDGSSAWEVALSEKDVRAMNKGVKAVFEGLFS